MKKRVLILLLLLLPLVGCDQFSKVQAVNYLMGSQPISYLNGFLVLTYHENPGAFLSLGASLPHETRTIIFSAFVTLFLLAVFAYLCLKPLPNASFIVGPLILAGGIGNVYDRLTNTGRVIDFVLLQLGPLHTGVFNLADVFIMLGVFLAAFFSTKWGKNLTNKLSRSRWSLGR